MIATIIIVGLGFIWLGYETKWLTIRLPRGGDYIMRLPSGAMITEEDLDFMIALIKPPKVTKQTDVPCWYCENGHDRQHIELGHLSYDLCECGASIIPLPKRRRVRRLPYAGLAGQINAVLARNYNPAVAVKYKTKAMI